MLLSIPMKKKVRTCWLFPIGVLMLACGPLTVLMLLDHLALLYLFTDLNQSSSCLMHKLCQSSQALSGKIGHFCKCCPG